MDSLSSSSSFCLKYLILSYRSSRSFLYYLYLPFLSLHGMTKRFWEKGDAHVKPSSLCEPCFLDKYLKGTALIRVGLCVPGVWAGHRGGDTNSTTVFCFCVQGVSDPPLCTGEVAENVTDTCIQRDFISIEEVRKINEQFPEGTIACKWCWSK